MDPCAPPPDVTSRSKVMLVGPKPAAADGLAAAVGGNSALAALHAERLKRRGGDVHADKAAEAVSASFVPSELAVDRPHVGRAVRKKKGKKGKKGAGSAAPDARRRAAPGRGGQRAAVIASAARRQMMKR